MGSVYPRSIEDRLDLNLRQGIKSSLPEIKKLIGLTLAIYLTNKQSVVDYGVSEGDKIILSDDQIHQLHHSFNDQLLSTKTAPDDFTKNINSNPLLAAQMEPLQVALELFLRLCKVSFPDGSSNSKERTGGARHPKRLSFTTNAEIIRLSMDEIELKNLLFAWTNNIDLVNGVKIYKAEIFDRICSLLTIFSEETQFKIRANGGKEIFFQQEGIYSEIEQDNSVEDKDAQEEVGPFRIFKRFITTGLHPYIQIIDGFSARPHAHWPNLTNYHGLVKAYLDCIPKRATITYTSEVPPEGNVIDPPLPDSLSRNKILFGAPGTGKSSKIKKIYAKGHIIRRVTFHPDYEYGSFVGNYKPISVEVPETDRKEVHYEYVPQEFTRIYCDAWNDPERTYFLVIEEINRGNCAQIFGDIFQSLDRDESGFSEYEVDTDTDLANYLKVFFLKNAKAASGLSEQLLKHDCLSDEYSKIILPRNLYLYATMNTSDQSLFPMDSAFKRRWDWEYVPIDLEPKTEDDKPIKLEIKLSIGNYQWGEFLERVNIRIYKAKENEDKQLGFWFVKAIKNVISENDFMSKVLFYLWYEVFRNEPEHSIFPTKEQMKDASQSVIEDFHYGLLFNINFKEALLRSIMENISLEIIQE